MSALTHSPGFFDFIGDIGRFLAPIATVVAPFFPPAAAIAGIATAASAIGRPSPAAALTAGPAQSVGTTFPSVPQAAGLEGEEPDIEPYTDEFVEEEEEE